MTDFKLFLVFSTLYCTLFVECNLSDKRLCGNKECTEIIAVAKTLLPYNRGSEGMLSFPANVELNIYSDPAGSHMNLLGAEYKGVRGYVPDNFIKEIKRIIKKQDLILVNTESIEIKEVPSIIPSKVDSLVVDGTTIHSDNFIDPSTPQQTLSTSTPQGKLENDIVPNVVKNFEAENSEVAKNAEIFVNHNLLFKEQNTQGEFNDKSNTQNIFNAKVNTEEQKGETNEDKQLNQKVDESTDSSDSFRKDEVVNNKITNIIPLNLNNDEDPNKIDPNNILPSTKESNTISDVKINPADETKHVNVLGDIDLKVIESKLDDKKSKSVLLKDDFLEKKEENTISNEKSSIIEEEKVYQIEVPPPVIKSPTEEEDKSNKLPEMYLNEKARLIEEITSTNGAQDKLNNVPEISLSKDLPIIEHPTFKIVQNLKEDQNNTVPIDEIHMLTPNFESGTNEAKDNIETVTSQDILNSIPTAKPFAIFKNAFSNANNNNLNSQTFENSEQTVNSVDEHDGFIDKPETNEDNEDSLQKIQSEAKPDEFPPSDKLTNQNYINFDESTSQNSDPFLALTNNDYSNSEIKEVFEEKNDDVLISKIHDALSCSDEPNQEYCMKNEETEYTKLIDSNEKAGFSIFNFIHEYQQFLLLLVISAMSVVVFLWGYMLIEKMKKVGPLIAKINNLEKSLIVSKKENEVLTEQISTNKSDAQIKNTIDSENAILELKSTLEETIDAKFALEEQVQILEKELENSAEVGLELNRMLSEVLSSQNCNETVMDNIEQLQKQLVEQQSTINTMNGKLNEKDTENHELQLELEINNKKVIDLQGELDKMALNYFKIEEEKDQLQIKYNADLSEYKKTLEKIESKFSSEKNNLLLDIQQINNKLTINERLLELKSKEYNLLKEATKNSSDNEEQFESLLNNNSLKAELQQLQADNKILKETLQQNLDITKNYENQVISSKASVDSLREKYEIADREKLEAITKLDVLSAYFKEKEAELQKELNKHECMWLEKKGETSSATERMKFLQGEVQNFKSQYESLKQELISQEVEYKSQISVLDKKAHENWVAARQAERKFEDARQEAAQLRNRITLRERNITDDKMQNRIPLPLETNGELPMSPLHLNDTGASPLLFASGRDHLTTSPPLPGMHPLLPPPPGMPFMPPPMHGLPPFMPPPPGGMFPGDHRPPPLGRMSSPPMTRRYSPDLEPYPYDRNSPSPTDDEYYDHPRRTYSPYNGRERDRRDYNRPPPPPMRNVIRNHKGTISSGSANSNESLENINRHNSKV